MMVVTKKETVASLALLVLAGLFLYLGFTQESSPWSQLTQSSAVNDQQQGITTEASAPIPGAGEAAPGEASKQEGASPPTMPKAAQNPLEGPQAQKLKEKTGAEFFIEYRLERDRVRSQEIQMLREVTDNPNSSPQVRTEAQQALIRLTEYMEGEMQLEALLRAKGYTEAAVFIQPNAVNVIVRAQELKEEDLNRIGDLVARTAGRKMDEVVIMPWP